ncbi:hypothetical protein PQX77_012836 [Marasmius sp. AFHP31]|nr:hypothetical protein PQX77_012836 [Marasmius sp. AFHP31]
MERYVATTNPFRKPAELTAVSIRKKVYTAQIMDFGERLFTVVTFEPENKEDKQTIKMIWRRVYEASATHTSPWFTQLFALGRSNLPMFIMRDELANGQDFSARYHRDAVVSDYLEYTRMTAIEALRADKALSRPVSTNPKDWTFNLKTRSWQYDLASDSVSPQSKDTLNASIYHPPIPLRRDTRPLLNASEIIAWFEQNFGEILRLPSTAWQERMVCPRFTEHHGRLTFETVADFMLPRSIFITGITRHGIHPIAGGDFADFWRGAWKGRSVGLKSMRGTRGSDIRRWCMEFCKEVLLWRRLNHPFVLPLLGIARGHSRLFMVSPFMDNGSLFQFLKVSWHTITDDTLLTLLYEVSQGVEYLHSEGVIHKDIKGVNILIDDEGHPLLTDFELTSFHGAKHDSDAPAGTMRWAAPELLWGGSDPTFATDIYSFGLVCIEVYSGQAPFAKLNEAAVLMAMHQGKRPSQPPRMPEDVWALVNRCWDQQSDLRPSAQEVCRELARIVGRLNWMKKYS